MNLCCPCRNQHRAVTELQLDSVKAAPVILCSLSMIYLVQAAFWAREICVCCLLTMPSSGSEAVHSIFNVFFFPLRGLTQVCPAYSHLFI